MAVVLGAGEPLSPQAAGICGRGRWAHRLGVFRPQLAGELPAQKLTPEFLSTLYFLFGADIAEMTEPDDETSTVD
jgi:hypothetical protein